MSRRRLLATITALTVALTTSGCDAAICGTSDGFDYVFELVGGVYRCKEVPEEPMHELLGHDDVKNYDGSWTEWGNLVNVPIEKDV
jgi:hypothetical protein